MKVDDFGIFCFTEQEVCDLLYQNHRLDLNNFILVDAEKFNQSNKALHTGFTKIKKYVPFDGTVEEFDRANQRQWFIPDQYLNLDIKNWLLNQCCNQEQTDRVTLEIELFEKTNLLNLVKYLKYLVDTMTQHNIVWGVGRGSSTSSYILYLIGLHMIDPIKYNIPIEEFFKQGN